MTVIVAKDTPPAIRGMLKRWFIEPKPNVSVGTVNKRTREKTLAYIRRNTPGLGLLIIASENNSQGFLHYGGNASQSGTVLRSLSGCRKMGWKRVRC